MGALISTISENVQPRLRQFLSRQKALMEQLICTRKEDAKAGIIGNEIGFTILVFRTCQEWAKAGRAMVFWDLDNTLGFEMPERVFHPRPGIADLFIFLAAEFPEFGHGILSYRPKSGEYGIERLFDDGGCLHVLRNILVHRLSARKFTIHRPESVGTPDVIGFRAPPDVCARLVELRRVGLTRDAILEKVGIIECLKRKGSFSAMPIHLVDDLEGIESAMGTAALSVAAFSPQALAELVRQDGIGSAYRYPDAALLRSA